MWYGIGDTLTTLGGLWYTNAAEIGPVAGPLMSAHGTWGLVLVKVLFIAIAAGVWYRLSRPTRVAIPLALTIVGTAVTVWNVFVILLSSGG